MPGQDTNIIRARFSGISGGREEVELPGALFNDLLVTDRRQALNPEDIISTDTTAGRVGLRHLFNENMEFRFEYTNRFNDIAGTISSAGNPDQFTSKRHHTELTPRLNITFDLLGYGSELYTGVDWFETDYQILSRFGLTDNTQTQYGYYGRLITSITDRLKIIGGYRHGG